MKTDEAVDRLMKGDSDYKFKKSESILNWDDNYELFLNGKSWGGFNNLPNMKEIIQTSGHSPSEFTATNIHTGKDISIDDVMKLESHRKIKKDFVG